MTGPARRSTLAFVAALVGVVGALVPMAGVRAASPTGRIDSPADTTPGVPTSPFDVKGSVQASNQSEPDDHLTQIRLTISTASDGVAVAQADVPVNGSPTSQSFDVSFTIPRNGRYRIDLTATEQSILGSSSGTAAESLFNLDVPPVPPAGLTATYDARGNATSVSWSRNAEPDLLGYSVERTDPTSGTFTHVWDTADPATTTFVDTAVKASGVYHYRARALRASSDQTPGPKQRILQSAPSADAVATVPAADGAGGGPTTSAGPGAQGAGPGGVGGSASGGSPALAPAGTVNLRDYAALLDKSRHSAGGGRSAAPDQGFKQTLPFAQGGKGGDSSADSGGRGLGSGAAEGRLPFHADLRAALPFVAGIMVITVWLMHVMVVRGEIRRVDELEALAPEGEEGRSPSAVAAGSVQS